MTKTIGPREAALRAQREVSLKMSRLPIVLSDPPPFGLGPDWKDKPAKAKAAFEAARTIPAVKPKAPRGRKQEKTMDPNQTAAEFLAKRQSQTLPAAETAPEPDAPKAPGKAKGARKAAAKGKTPAAKKTKPAPAPRKKAAAKKAKGKAPETGTKLALIAGLLNRKSGCTGKDILKATGWPAVSVPQQARALKIRLKKVKEGRETRYFAA